MDSYTALCELTRCQDPEAREYFRFHRKRLMHLLKLFLRYGRTGDRVLDIGRSMVTRMLAEAFPACTVESLGLGDPEPGHCTYDLNDAVDPSTWPALEPYGLIVFAETIEHLHTSPFEVLACVASLTAPGGRLILQTPNAASLAKRIRLLRGENPFEMPRRGRANPGHFREYTVSELREITAQAGFRTLSTETLNYFDPPGWRNKTYHALCDWLPASFREGITIVCEKV